MALKKYAVKGRYKGERINEIVSAYSKKQAKLQAGFNAGIGGYELQTFMKSRKIKVVRMK